MRLKLILTATALCLAGHATIAQELTGTLEKIRSTGVIAIGHRELSISFSYYDKNEKVVGYAMDLCYVVADAVKVNLGLAKLEIKLVPITPSLRIPSVLSEKIDLACETITNTRTAKGRGILVHLFRRRQSVRLQGSCQSADAG